MNHPHVLPRRPRAGRPATSAGRRGVSPLAGPTALLATGVLLLSGCGSTSSAATPGTASGVPTTAAPTGTATPTATESAPTTVVAPPAGPFELPPAGSRVVVFGDSYTEGEGASRRSAAYPAQLASHFDWDVDPLAAGGTGFIARGTVDADYLERLAELPEEAPALIVVQGGLNDALAGVSQAEELAAARTVLRSVRDRYPETELVVLGPPATQITDPVVVHDVDRALRRAARELGAHYVSPLAEDWELNRFTEADGLHPDDAGHAELARLLAATLERLSD